MKLRILLFFVLYTSLLTAQTVTNPLNVLFVGNSLTYFNDIPLTFKAIAEEQGYYINLEQYTPGGTGFVNHLASTELFQKFDNTVWDYVILQPGTSESVEISQPIEFTINQAKQLRYKIYENSPCASIYLYETSYGIIDSSPEELQQYLDIQELIKNNLIQMSNETAIPLVPVGESFQNSIQQNPNLFLWVSYGDIHQNANGAFLAACTFYNALFQKAIINSSINGALSALDAIYFRDIAEVITFDSLDLWNINTLTANANFTFSISNGITVNFTNTSTNYDTVFWDFGDGITSSEINPTHEYDFLVQNSYDVYLTAYLGCKENHFKQTIFESSLSITSPYNKDSFIVYPNPVKDNLIIISESESYISYIIYDVFGKQVQSETELNINQQINMFNFPVGVYFLVIQSGLNTKKLRIIKQ